MGATCHLICPGRHVPYIVLSSEVVRRGSSFFIFLFFLLLGYLLFIVVATLADQTRRTRAKHSVGQDAYARLAIQRRLCHQNRELTVFVCPSRWRRACTERGTASATAPRSHDRPPAFPPHWPPHITNNRENQSSPIRHFATTPIPRAKQVEILKSECKDRNARIDN